MQKNGAEMLEMDLHLTKDGVAVVFHDETLTRVTGVAERISNLDYDELPTSFKSTLPVPFPQRSGQSIETDTFDTRIPKLEEAIFV